jgi:signal transduction histidine kinase
VQRLQEKLEAPILDVMQWADELLDSVFGSITVMHIRDDIQAMRGEAARALAQIPPLLHAIERQDVRGGINLAHQTDNLLLRARVNYVFRFRQDYAHRLTRLQQNILSHIETSSIAGCEYLARIKSYLSLVSPGTVVHCDYYYLPTVLRDFLRGAQPDVELHIAPGVGEFYGNVEGLRRALTYVLENRRHAGEDAEVQVYAARESNASVRLLIVDNGPGINPKDAPHIFEPFYQAKPDDPGMGLGLTLAQRLMRQQGGDVQLHGASDEDNGGAAFAVSLPIGITKPK